MSLKQLRPDGPIFEYRIKDCLTDYIFSCSRECYYSNHTQVDSGSGASVGKSFHRPIQVSRGQLRSGKAVQYAVGPETTSLCSVCITRTKNCGK